MHQQARLLLVDGDANLRHQLLGALHEAGLQAHGAASLQEARTRLRSEAFGIVITELHLPDASGLEVLQALEQMDEDVPIVILSDPRGVEEVIEAMSQGNVFHFVRKPLADIEQLLLAVDGAAEYGRLRRQNRQFGAIGRLSAGIAHDLRNPLSIMSNALFLLRRRLRERDEDVNRQVGILERELQRCEHVITNLLDLARERPVETQRHPLAEVVQEALSKVHVPPEVTIQMELDEAQAVELDRSKLVQVLVNLLTNAMEAMPSGGSLWLRSGHQNGTAVIEIEDTGGGLPLEVRQHLFEPLVTTKPNGIGLGLLISRKLVEAHHGRLELESRSGQGTTARITLPQT